MGLFLQRSLALLSVDDPFLVRKAQDVSTFLETEQPKGVSAFTIDLKDLYYSLPHASICEAAEEALENIGAIRSQNECRINLRSTFIKFKEGLYIPNKGACIGSCIAPTLSDLVIARHDRGLHESLKGSTVQKVFPFVDDNLIIHKVQKMDKMPMTFFESSQKTWGTLRKRRRYPQKTTFSSWVGGYI